MKKFIMLMMMGMMSVPAFAGEITVNVKGMVCSMCAQGIQKKFSAAGVDKVHVDLDKKVVHLNGELTDEQITKIITEAGYNVAGIERK